MLFVEKEETQTQSTDEKDVMSGLEGGRTEEEAQVSSEVKMRGV